MHITCAVHRNMFNEMFFIYRNMTTIDSFKFLYIIPYCHDKYDCFKEKMFNYVINRILDTPQEKLYNKIS